MKSPGMSEREWKRESSLRPARTLPLLRRTTKRFINTESSSLLADLVIIFNLMILAAVTVFCQNTGWY